MASNSEATVSSIGKSDIHDTVTGRKSSPPPSKSLLGDPDLVEDGTVEELGYTPVYRRVFRSIGNLCMVVSLTS